jgi:hypothetical protein
MKRIAIFAAVLLITSWISTEVVRADLVLSITSPDDLTNLAVGATATFDVSVTGTSADPPGYLSASIQYDPTVFGDPTVSLGAIVPDPGGFYSFGTGGGAVNGTYDDSILGTAAITTDGVFYSFTLTRLDSPATSLSFSSYAAMDDSGGVISVSTSPDSISVAAAPGGAVPEPSSLVLALLGMTLPAGWNIARAQARRRGAMTAR